MKYNLIICQKEIIERGYDLDFIDAGILSSIHTLVNTDFIQDFKDDDGKYYWISPSILLKEIPLILRSRVKGGGFKNFSKDAIKKRISHLCNSGFLTKHRNNQVMGRLYLRVNAKTYEMFRSPSSTYTGIYPTDIKPHPTDTGTYPLPTQERTPTDTGTYNNSTNNNSTNNNKDILSTLEKVNDEPLLKNKEKDSNYTEYLEIFEFFKSTTNKKVRLPQTKTLVERSDRYKKFISTKKKGYSLEDMKAVIKVKNEEWKDDGNMKKHININTLFGVKFEKYLEQAENLPTLNDIQASNTNIPETNEKPLGVNLSTKEAKGYEWISKQVQDTRFTPYIYSQCFTVDKIKTYLKSKTQSEVIGFIQQALSESASKAFNKNIKIEDLIKSKFIK